MTYNKEYKIDNQIKQVLKKKDKKYVYKAI